MVGPFLRYSLYRFAILIVVFLVLMWVGVGSWMLLLLTAVISAALSYLLLRPQRDAVTRDLIEKREKNQAQIDADSAAEDADLDAQSSK